MTTTALKEGGAAFADGDSSRLAALERAVDGAVALADGEQTGAVTGLGLTFTPSRVTLTVVQPDMESPVISAQPAGAPTRDGFGYVLSAVPGGGYVMQYRVT